MANFPSVTAAGAFESPAVQNAIKTLAEQSVADRLAALEYDSGPRSLNNLVTGRASGDVRIRRLGPWVILTVENLVMSEAGSGVLASPALPFGWRPIATQPGPGQGLSNRIQVTSAGNVQAYNWTTAPIFATVIYPTNEAPGALVGSAL